jgi:hypothetical protein
MTRIKDVLPPFQLFLSQEERDRLASMSKEKRQAFLRALALSMLIREPPNIPPVTSVV